MSLRMIDPLHPSGVPKSWRDKQNGTEIRIPWINSMPWDGFYSQVKSFYERNGYPVPSREIVEDFLCTQMPGFCTGNQEYRPPAPVRTGGCKSCGGWK